MDQSHRPTTYRQLRTSRPRRSHPIFNLVVAVGASLIGYGAFISGAQGPAYGILATPGPVAATLSRNGTDVTITGSVNAMFQQLGTFTGPNRAAKQNRARITPDPLEFARGFGEARLQLASLRASAFADPVPVVPTPKAPVPGGPAPRIAVASLGPAPASQALSAIESIAPGAGAPVPVVLSEELAYARADAPLTTFDAAPVDASGNAVSERDLWCLSQAVYFEARGESYKGQVAVAQVVINRLHHRLYPNTICGVVFQNQHMRNACQFSFACDGIPERVVDGKSWKQAQEIAKGVVSGKLTVPEVGKATHYHASYVYPHWAPRMKKVTKIGLHGCYQFKRNWRFG